MAVTGWSDGSLSTVERPNFIKVRFDDDKSEVEVFNESVPLARGIQVYIYKGFDGLLRARHLSKNYQFRDLIFAFIKNHSQNHTIYSVDPLYVQTRAILNLHPYVSDNWDITVRPGWIVFGSQAYLYTGETVSIQAHRPTSGARFVLLSLGLEDVAGVMTVKMIVTPGTSKEAPVAPNDFPAIPEGTSPICAVRASINKRKLIDTQDQSDLYDLRLTSAGVSTAATGGAKTTELLSGVTDGVNKQFSTSKTYVTGSTEVYVNGLLQNQTSYSETPSGILFSEAPLNRVFNDELIISYQEVI